MKVAVVGGGAMGAATSWRLARRGVEVVCFDRFSPPHPYGSTFGESRIIRTAYFEGPWYVPLLQESFVLWRELEAATGAQVLRLTGALMIGDPASEAVTGALASARQHGLDHELLDAGQIRGRYSGHIVRDQEVAVLDRQAGILNPEVAVASMLSEVPAVRRNTPVDSLSALRDDFDRIVVAAGPWTPELVDWIPLHVERQVHVWFALEEGVDFLTPDRFPVFIRQSIEFGDVYGFPTLDGESAKFGYHHYGEYTDPHHIRREVDESDIGPLRRMASALLRGLTPNVARTLTCMYTNTRDGHFVIDFSPEDHRVLVISACSGHGFKFAPIIGDIVADLVTEGGTRRDISHFSAARFTPAHVPNDHNDRD